MNIQYFHSLLRDQNIKFNNYKKMQMCMYRVSQQQELIINNYNYLIYFCYKMAITEKI